MPATTRFLIAALLAGILSVPVQANPGTRPISDAELLRQIDETDWSLKYSSVAPRIDAAQQLRSAALLARAREEIAVRHLRTAQDLIRQAAAPLVAMTSSPSDLATSHPEPRRQLEELTSALVSISEGADQIAREKGIAAPLLDETRAALRQSDELQHQGKPQLALELLNQRYAAVQAMVARWRDGGLFIVKAPDGRDQNQWEDGVRRIDERKQLTEYLITEANAEGIDATPLFEALSIADDSLQAATGYASSQRWDKAYRSLDLAYARIEASWKKVGIEW